MEFNLEKLIIDVFNPDHKEVVLIMCDIPHGDIKLNNDWQERFEMAKEWHECFEKVKEGSLEVLPILFYKATGANSAPLPKYGEIDGEKVVIEDIIKDVNICIALTEYSATAPLKKLTKKIKTLRVASMPRVLRATEKTALSADYGEVAKKCSFLAPKMNMAVGAHVLFSTGHECYFDLRKSAEMQDNGQCREGGCCINLPSGEVYVVPYEGGDEELGKSRTDGMLPVKYVNELIVFSVNENKIKEVIGSGPKALQMKDFFEEDEGRRNIAEFALPCNDKAVVRGNILEDEKAGFHWAYGLSEHFGGRVGVKDFKNAQNVIHQDVVYAKDSPIQVKELFLEYPDRVKELIMENGEYTVF
jgi:leucyl aminopeptidase (aminopeptidase T)